MCLCSPSSIGTGQRAVMLCGWEGNCRSGVALAMRHKLSGIPTYGLNGLGKEDKHPHTLHWSTTPLPIFSVLLKHFPRTEKGAGCRGPPKCHLHVSCTSDFGGLCVCFGSCWLRGLHKMDLLCLLATCCRSKAFIYVCLCVCVFARTIERKWLKLKSQNLPQGLSIMSRGYPFNSRLKGQRSRSQGHKCKNIFQAIKWLA